MPRICSIEGCSNPAKARGMCKSCYSRWWRNGNPRLKLRRSDGLVKENRPEYIAWCGIKNRCLNKKNPKYPSYGGRGITICDRWLEKPNGFANFLKDLGKKPSKKYSIDRINNDGPYSPKNCRWATPKEQANNRRPMPMNPKRNNNIYITWNIETHTIAEWGRRLNLSDSMLYQRYRKYGWRGDRLFEPSHKPK